jgi:hypothetical protein
LSEEALSRGLLLRVFLPIAVLQNATLNSPQADDTGIEYFFGWFALT